MYDITAGLAQDESRLKRRLEDEVSRRWQRNTSISFLSNSSGPKQHQQQQGGGGKGMVQMIESGGIDPSVAAGVATMLQNPSLAAFKPNFNFAAFSSDTKRVRAPAISAHRHNALHPLRMSPEKCSKRHCANVLILLWAFPSRMRRPKMDTGRSLTLAAGSEVMISLTEAGEAGL
jgi:hypothetical protein